MTELQLAEELPAGLNLLFAERHEGIWYLEFTFMFQGKPVKLVTQDADVYVATKNAVVLFPKAIERLERDGYDMGMTND